MKSITKSRSTAGKGMNLSTRYHINQKGKGAYKRKNFKPHMVEV